MIMDAVEVFVIDDDGKLINSAQFVGRPADDAKRLRELERETRELQMELAFLKKGVPRTLAA